MGPLLVPCRVSGEVKKLEKRGKKKVSSFQGRGDHIMAMETRTSYCVPDWLLERKRRE